MVRRHDRLPMGANAAVEAHLPDPVVLTGGLTGVLARDLPDATAQA